MAALSAAVLASALAASCFNPHASDAFVADLPGFPEGSVADRAAWYLPNRVVDALDLVHAGVAVGPGLGIEAQLTRWARLEWSRGHSYGLGWFGRFGRVPQAGAYWRSTFTDRTDPAAPVTTLWHTPRWDVGLSLHLALVQVQIGVAPFDELADLLAGLVAYDLKGDDF